MDMFLNIDGSMSDEISPTSSKSIFDELRTSIKMLEENGTVFDDDDSTPSLPNTITQNLPDYEPFFPELSENLDEPILLLKTTVITSVDYETKTLVQSRLRTYTFVVTRVNGDEQIVTSTTEVKPQTKTVVVTEPVTRLTTLTLLDFDVTKTKPFVPLTVYPPVESSNSTQSHPDKDARMLEEARYNLATRVMSNGVEVIVAGDKTTLPGEPDIKRLLPSTIYKPITLKPSTISNHMMMIAPKDASNIQQLSSSIYTNEFVTKTCLTTFTYLTTFLENGTTTVSSHEQVVSNTATEERNSGKILPTPTMGITLTQYPNLAVGVFLTTYTYLNTIMDGEQPLVVTSKHTVSNTVTAPDDYLSLLQPLEKASAVKDTNTYYSTVSLEKTVYEDDKSQIVSTNEVVTQVVITESIPPKATSVMTSYVAFDVEDPEPNKLSELITSDVVKTYFVTYTYYNTVLEGEKTVIHTNISTASDIVTEKLFLHPKRNKNATKSVINTSPIGKDTTTHNKKKTKVDQTAENFQIVATKTYMTTFTYFTTLLQQNSEETSTVISSHSRVVENVVTETLEPSLLDKKFIKSFRKQIKDGSNSIVKLATLSDGNKLEVTAIAKNGNSIKPTKVLPIEKTTMPEVTTTTSKSKVIESSKPNVITGSTILFVEDDDPFAALSTPTLSTSSSKIVKTQSKNELNSLLSSEIVRKPSKSKNNKRNASKTSIKASATAPSGTKPSLIKPAQTTHSKLSGSKVSSKNHTVSEPPKKKTNAKLPKQPTTPVSNLLGLGSINMNSLQALKPVLNAMAGLIQTNLKASRRNDSEIIKPKKPERVNEIPADVQNRSPIYIPVGDIEVAESQNIGSLHFSEQLPWNTNGNGEYKDQVVVGKPTHESPLLNGGIPISPGEVITANSDVIIGKPGRIGPRIPAIPLNPDLANDDTPIGMKPPPAPQGGGHHHHSHGHHNKAQNSQSHQQGYGHGHLQGNSHGANNNGYHSSGNGLNTNDHITTNGVYNHGLYSSNNNVHVNNEVYASGHGGLQQNNIPYIDVHSHQSNGIPQNNYPDDVVSFNHGDNLPLPTQNRNELPHTPKRDDYVGPPPPRIPVRPPNVVRGEKYHNKNQRPIPVTPNNGKINPIPVPFKEHNYQQITNDQPNINHQNGHIKINFHQQNIQENYHHEPTLILGSRINEFNLKSSILNEPLVHPEVIERSTGQPLLVNIQPSQVAFVNIPHNRTTALIYGGSTETHHNGQYFDDPSPYPEPEFSGIESFNNGVPQLASVYNGNPNQKEVVGVIKVGTQLINVNPEANLNSRQEIKPTRPNFNDVLVNPNIDNRDVSLKVPPISFEMVHNGNDFNAHIINHGQELNPPPVKISFDTTVQESHQVSVGQGQVFNDNVHNYPQNNFNQGQSVLESPFVPQKDKNINHDNAHLPIIDNIEILNKHLLDNNPTSNGFIGHGVSNGNNDELHVTFVEQQPNLPINGFNQQAGVPIDEKPPPPPTNTFKKHKNNNNNIPYKPAVAPVPQDGITLQKLRPPTKVVPNRPNIHHYRPKYPNVGKRPRPPQATPDVFMTPPAPVTVNPNIYTPLVPHQGYTETITNQPIIHIPIAPHQPNTYRPNVFENNDEIIDHKEPDHDEEEAEVIQESNSRPLRPGQLPHEIQKQTTEPPPPATTDAVSIHTQQNVNFEIKVSNEKDIFGTKPSVILRPRPFETGPFVRPENQQTNEINHQEPEAEIKLPVSIGTSLQFGHVDDYPNAYTNGVSTTENVVKNVFGYKTRQPTRSYYSTTLRSTPVITVVKPVDTKYVNTVTIRKPISVDVSTARPIRPIDNIYRVHGIYTSRRPNTNHALGHVVRITKKPSVDTRPKITSLPIDVVKTTTAKPYTEVFEKPSIGNSQTEEPFHEYTTKSSVTTSQKLSSSTQFYFNYGDTVSTTIRTTKKQEESTYQNLVLNIGEVPPAPTLVAPTQYTYANITAKEEQDMAIMKPPPVTDANVVKPPDVNMQPPKIEVNSPSGSIYHVPNISEKKPGDLEAHANTPKPFVPKPSEDMLPPPPVVKHEEVMGMVPPPPDATHKPLIIGVNQNVSTHKPVFSLEIDIPTTQRPVSTTGRRKLIRTTIRKRPVSRRPTTTTNENVEATTSKIRKPIIVNVNGSELVDITPTPTIQTPSTMEVIIGHPQITKENNEKPKDRVKIKLQNSIDIQGTESTIVASKENTHSQSTSIPTPPIVDFTAGVHHGGNEIKIIDENTETKQLNKLNILPTRYITHTKTSTVTITKTTVVKSLGAPPSTMTILVTKTEKSTVVDVVTEFHTLIKPTSIIETITTTVNPTSVSSLYPNSISYGGPYGTVQPTPVVEGETTIPTKLFKNDDDDDSLEEFIINPPPETSSQEPENYNDGDSILIVMTDKKGGSVVKIPPSTSNNYDHQDVEVSHETQNRDEMIASNEVNRVLLGGILIASPPSLDTKDVRTPVGLQTDKCAPECKASKNELCQKVDGLMRCVCRPGFARMFPDRPCKPTYTYTLKLALERYGQDQLQFEDNLADASSTQFTKLATITHDGLDRMVMQSDLRDIYHGIQVKGYEPSTSGFGIISEFYLQLSDNADENRLQDVFKKYLRNNNYSLGGTELYAAREALERLEASDFDECTNQLYHDCSEHAQCFNLKGTYTCSCKEGFADLSENTLYPGRVCSAELVGCEKCHYHGTCYTRDNDQILCECFQWYAGENCHINLKVLLIALVTLGTILFTLLLVCIIMTCCRKRPQAQGATNGMSFLPQRIAGSHSRRSTLDRRAMIQDTSSESGQSDTNTLPYVAKKTKKPKGALKKPTADLETGTNTLSFPDQKDRSLTVMIPRAKYHPAPPTSPHLNLASFEKRKMSAASSNETKLLSYLDAGPSPNKIPDKRKYSLTNSETYLNEKQASRKTSGALVSAGFEVSATVVGNNMGTLGTIMTTCGTEADRSENATLIQKISADLLSSTGTQSQFNTFKQSIAHDEVDETMKNWLDIPPRVTTISESRSYDETTIQAATKSYRNDYDSKPSSQHPNDEANTMAERDLGSTFLLPHTHLYKPERGSDISGFESL